MANMTIDSTTGRYYAEVSVTGNFNLHLEKSFACPILISVKTDNASSKFAPAHSFNGECKVIDFDFIVEIPKKVRIELIDVAPSGAAAPTYTITSAE